MNRRAFFAGLASVLPVAAVAAMPKESPRQALQGGAPQCPECLETLPVEAPHRYREPEAYRAWLAKDRHTLRCDRCAINVVWKCKL